MSYLLRGNGVAEARFNGVVDDWDGGMRGPVTCFRRGRSASDAAQRVLSTAPVPLTAFEAKTDGASETTYFSFRVLVTATST